MPAVRPHTRFAIRSNGTKFARDGMGCRFKMVDSVVVSARAIELLAATTNVTASEAKPKILLEFAVRA